MTAPDLPPTMSPEPAHPAPEATDAGSRPASLRMASLHLRVGLLALARAELEALAGRGVLDDDALVDLAEARWRTGDLAGAGEAADALLSTGRETPLALVIAAEAAAEDGRPAEARRLAGRALEALDGPLDPVFAGLPRSLIWPSDAGRTPQHEAVPGAVRMGAAPADGEPLASRDREPALAAPVTGSASVPGPAPASSAAAAAYAGGRAALEAGDAAAAAVRLAVAIRLDPGFAPSVLEAVGPDPAEPALLLVAGDALRLVGRESDALAAFGRASGLRGDAPPPGHEPDRAERDDAESDAGTDRATPA